MAIRAALRAELVGMSKHQAHVGRHSTHAYIAGQVYTCARCAKENCSCFEASDDTPALCDACAILIQDLWAAPVSGIQPIMIRRLVADDLDWPLP